MEATKNENTLIGAFAEKVKAEHGDKFHDVAMAMAAMKAQNLDVMSMLRQQNPILAITVARMLTGTMEIVVVTLVTLANLENKIDALMAVTDEILKLSAEQNKARKQAARAAAVDTAPAQVAAADAPPTTH